jgi:hypothetical protein
MGAEVDVKELETGAAPRSADWTTFWAGRGEAGFGTDDLLPKHLLGLELLDRLRLRDSIRTVCEFGCGSGVLLSSMRARYPDLELLGADFVDFARRRVEGLGLRYLEFDLRRDTLDQAVDVAMLIDVLEHFHDPSDVLRRVSSARYIIAVVPNFSFLTERWSALKGGVPFQWRGRLHACWFNVPTLEAVTAPYRVVDRAVTFPRRLQRLPFHSRFKNLLATSLGVSLQPGAGRIA